MIQPRFNPGVAVLIPGCPYHQFPGSFPSRFQFLSPDQCHQCESVILCLPLCRKLRQPNRPMLLHFLFAVKIFSSSPWDDFLKRTSHNTH
jgi:hypothetical protein